MQNQFSVKLSAAEQVEEQNQKEYNKMDAGAKEDLNDILVFVSPILPTILSTKNDLYFFGIDCSLVDWNLLVYTNHHTRGLHDNVPFMHNSYTTLLQFAAFLKTIFNISVSCDS